MEEGGGGGEPPHSGRGRFLGFAVGRRDEVRPMMAGGRATEAGIWTMLKPKGGDACLHSSVQYFSVLASALETDA